MQEIPPGEDVPDAATNETPASPSESTFTDNIPVGTYILRVEPDGTPSFPFLSKRYLEMGDLTREEVAADPYIGFTRAHPDDLDALLATNLEAIEKGTPFYWEGRYVIRGNVVWGLIESFPRKLADGATIWEGACTDITRQKVAEERLRQSEQNLQRILENIPIPIAYADVTDGGRIYFVNHVFTNAFGWAVDDLPPVPEWLVTDSPDSQPEPLVDHFWATAVAQALTTDGRVAERDYKLRCKNGDQKTVLVSGTVVDQQLIISFVDLTERNRVQAALARANEKIMRQQMEDSKLTEKLRLVEDMHDGFGSQLTIAGMMVERGQMSQTDMATLIQDCMADLHLVLDTLGEGDRSLQEALLDFQHRTASRLADHPTKISWDLQLSRARITPERVILQTLRIIQEALANALKHSGASEIHIAARQCEPDSLTIEMRDNGRGMPPNLVRGRGLNNMETRARAIGAQLGLAPVATGGTLVSLRL